MRGSVVFYFAYNVAYEIRTTGIREILSETPFPFEVRVGSSIPKDLRITKPLTIIHRAAMVDAGGRTVEVRPAIKLFDVGVISISWRVPVAAESLAELVPMHALPGGPEGLAERSDALAREVAKGLGDLLVRPDPEPAVAEAYTVFCLEDVGDPAVPVPEWVSARRPAVAALLAEEKDADRLSADQVVETLEGALSYTRDDMTVIDWDAALIVERSGSVDDVLYVIELANLQLEQFRLLDDSLDRYFAEAYEDVQEYWRKPRLFRTPKSTLRTLRSIRMDVTKMSEAVTNITKFVGDWYLARVHLACKARFHIDEWETSVRAKLAELDRIYTVVRSEVIEHRMLVLEAAIVALFILDVLILIFGKP